MAADELRTLLQRPLPERDGGWVVRFSEVALDTEFVVADPPVERGPDGFDYYRLRIPGPGEAGPLHTLRAALPQCTDAGTGCAILDGDEPAFVLYYAYLWALREDGLLYDPMELDNVSGDTPEGQVISTAPDAAFLPPYARKVLRDFLRSVGVDRPEVVHARQTVGRPTRGLGFNVYPDSFATAEEYERVMESLHWYVRHDIGIVDGRKLPGMTPL